MATKFTFKNLKNSLLILVGVLFFRSAQAQCPIIGDSIACENQTKTYFTTATGVGYTYQWNAYGGVASGSGSSTSVLWGNVGTGQVTLTVRNSLNQIVCTGTKNITILANPKPFILPSYIAKCGLLDSSRGNSGQKDRREDECLSVCDSTWITYTTPLHAGSTYSWVITGSATVIPSVSNSIQVYWTGVGSGLVTVTETSANGCVGTNKLCVVIVAKPNASFTTMPTASGGVVNACLNQSIQFINTSNTGGGSPLWTYTWVFGDGNTTILSSPSNGNTSHAYAASGSYTAMLIVENECHCKDTAFVKINVSSDPGPDIQCVSTVCPGTTVTYTTSATCPSYLWTVTNGTIIGSNTNQSVTITWGSTGPGYLTLQTIGCTGTCPSPSTVVVPIITPTATITGNSNVCLYECKKYRVSCTIPVDSIVWNVPAGVTVISSTINVHEIEVCFYNPSFISGVISVNYFHNTPGAVPSLTCGGTASININVRPQMNVGSVPEICDLSNFSAWHNSQPGGTIQWVVTPAGSNTPVGTSTQSSNTTFSFVSWPYGPGLFNITANDLSGTYCDGPQSISLTVNPIPAPPDSINGPQSVCPNTPHMYLGFATASNMILNWTISGGSPSNATGPFVSVLWGAGPSYSISLTQTDPLTGCTSSAINYTVNSYLPAAPPVIFGPNTACTNSTVPSAYTTSSPGDNFSWSISPNAAGSVISGNNTNTIDVQWNNWTGTAQIILTRTICGSTSTVTYNVTVAAPPIPNMTVPTPICQGTAVNLSSSTLASSYSWNMGNGATVTGNPAVYIYTSPGTYTVALTTTYTGSCSGSATNYATIVVNPIPNVTISTPDPNIFCGTVGTVNMFVAAPAISTTYQWYQFPSTLVGSGTSYSSNIIGTYYVIATNTFGCIGKSNDILIDTSCTRCVPNPNYSLNFNIIKQTCNKDSFAGTITPGGSSPFFIYDDVFGTPQLESGTNTSHIFPEPGYYRVQFCAKVPNINNTDSCIICATKVDTIKYIPNFYFSLICGSGSNMTISLVNTTKILSGMPTPSYAWSYNGNPTFSTSANPSINLPAGTYNFTLTVNGVCVKNLTIIVPGKPVANFTAMDSICVGTPMIFNNTTTGLYNQSHWFFGDASQSLITSPIKTYASAGSYSVKLVVRNIHGCRDSITKNVRVLPNTLSVSISAGGPTSFCEGNTVTLTRNITGGYPGYSTLWSNTQTGASINAQYTGQYYVTVTDSKGCFAKSNLINVMVYPKPRPKINGPNKACLNQTLKFTVNYNNPPYNINWSLDGAVTPWYNQTVYTIFGGASVGSHILTVQVTSPDGCIGNDTFYFTVYPNPNINIIPGATLCANMMHTLTGVSTSPITNWYWNTGANTPSITVGAPTTYSLTVVDTNGCRNTATKTIRPLPDFCGLLTGCYEICDTVTLLVWHAPKGYAAYQWFYNGNPIPWATNDTLHVPLYQSGTYTLMLTSVYGCSKMSNPINIKFINCGSCIGEVGLNINCSVVDGSGNQTYSVTMNIVNNLANGAGISVSSPQGTITSLSPGTLNLGANTVTFTFTDNSPVNSFACFNIVIFTTTTKCDTTICEKLPPCDKPCEKQIKIKSIECAGKDVSGNPMYQICLNVTWLGSNGSTLTLGSSGGTVSPNSFTINNGANSICFVYTDLPPYSFLTTIYTSFFDSASQTVCRDSIKLQLPKCPDCQFNVYGLCVHCEKYDPNGSTYNIELTVNNTLGGPANISVLPISQGTFGLPSPSTVPNGISQVNIPFTDNNPRDSIVCFRVLMTYAGTTCYQDVCVYLPLCDETGLGSWKQLSYFSVAPNPANSDVNIIYQVSDNESVIEVLDATGKLVHTVSLSSEEEILKLNTSEWTSGMYFVNLKTNGVYRGSIKLSINH